MPITNSSPNKIETTETTKPNNNDDYYPTGAVVIFAKCPIPHASKTRLQNLLGPEGAAIFARAMLSDILVSVTQSPEMNTIMKVLVYAPGDQVGETHMKAILHDLGISYYDSDLSSTSSSACNNFNDHDEPISTSVKSSTWRLLPMLSSSSTLSSSRSNSSTHELSSNQRCLTSSNLGDKLSDALDRVRRCLSHELQLRSPSPVSLHIGGLTPESSQLSGNTTTTTVTQDTIISCPTTTKPNEHKASPPPTEENHPHSTPPVLFLGMDAPELPLHELARAFYLSTNTNIPSCPTTPLSPPPAYLTPARDGGYTSLCLPSHAPSPAVFQNVLWSSPTTAKSQIENLQKCGVEVVVGSMGDDIDEEEDVWRLADRLCGGHRDGGGQVVTCPYTLETLIALGLVEKEEKIMLTTMSVSTTGQEEGVAYVVKRDMGSLLNVSPT